mgnify:CR=1 FL=1
MKIEIKNKWTGSVLFELEKEDNTIKDTLIEAVKHNANLCGADLSGANLFGANLSWAILCDADLRGANLCGANLCGADLRNANLSGANLSGANLCGADLSYANLRDANLRDADLRGVKEVPYIPMNCPSDGTFIGWKKVNNHLIQLEIPEDAKRSSATTMKCRCDKAKVLKIVNLDTNKVIDEITNIAYYQNTVYKVGEMVYPDSFDEDRWNECSHGIHFFVNKQEAIDY